MWRIVLARTFFWRVIIKAFWLVRTSCRSSILDYCDYFFLLSVQKSMLLWTSISQEITAMTYQNLYLLLHVTLTDTIQVTCRTLTMQFFLQTFKCHLFTSLLTSNYQTTFQYLHLFLVLLLILLPPHNHISLRPNFTRDWKKSQGDLFATITNSVQHKFTIIAVSILKAIKQAFKRPTSPIIYWLDLGMIWKIIRN